MISFLFEVLYPLAHGCACEFTDPHIVIISGSYFDCYISLQLIIIRRKGGWSFYFYNCQ